MRKQKDIKTIAQRYRDAVYTRVRKEQSTDQEYYDDSFDVPEVQAPHHIYRSGLGVRIIDAPAEQIVTSNPQATLDIIKGSKDSVSRISRMMNKQWLHTLRRQNPNPFKETVKNPLLRGETFIRLVANPAWTVSNQNRGLPVHFIKPDPMVIFASPEEDDDGVPEIVVVFYNRQLKDVLVAYPSFTNPKKHDIDKTTPQVEWMEFWDNDTRYAEADGEPVLGGVKPNPYGFTPFVRRYSGFGRRSPDGELAHLIVSDVRRSRDLLLEECATRSNIASIQYLYAHKDIMVTSPGEINVENFKENIKLGADVVNILDMLPEGTEVGVGLSRNLEQVADTTLQHHRDIIGELNQRHPFIIAGFPFGTSGRQQSMTQMSGMRRYDSVVENAETMWATALERAWRICQKLDLQPPDINKQDIKSEFRAMVDLRAKDPTEQSQKIVMGDRLWAMGKGSISLRRFHMEYQNLTSEESDDEMARIFSDQLMFYNPQIAAALAATAAREGGLEEALELLRQQGQEGLRQPPAPTTMQRVKGEAETELGFEQSPEPLRGARQSPELFTRNR